MKTLAVVLILVLCASASWAQLLPPNKNGVSMASWNTIVRDVEASKKFWILLGGTPIKIDGTDVIKFPGVFVFLTPGTPIGDSNEAVIDHVGLTMLNAEDYLAKLKTAGVKFLPSGDANRDSGPVRGIVATPDGV